MEEIRKLDKCSLFPETGTKFMQQKKNIMYWQVLYPESGSLNKSAKLGPMSKPQSQQ